MANITQRLDDQSMDPSPPSITSEEIVVFRRRATKARLLALCTLPLFAISLYSAWGMPGISKTIHLSSVVTFALFVLAPAFVGVMFARLSLKRAMEYDKYIRIALWEASGASGPMNLSNVPASTSSKSISRRIWGTRLKRVVNFALLAVLGLAVVAVGGALCVGIFLEFDDHPNARSVGVSLLGMGALVVSLGVFGCMHLLKSGQRLTELQSSLVDVRVYLAEVEASPGSLQLTDCFHEGGRLSIEHERGSLTQIDSTLMDASADE